MFNNPFDVWLSLFVKGGLIRNHSYRNAFTLRVDEKSFSYKTMITRIHFESKKWLKVIGKWAIFLLQLLLVPRMLRVSPAAGLSHISHTT